ncbi:MAG: hypothetical protein K2W99_03880 [Chthoniobacterales bacterium]|nr:hypothetical protein [Chthoniobacterales bacterium]
MTTSLSFSIITLHHGAADADDPVVKAVASLASQAGVQSEHLFHHTAGITGLWNKLFQGAALAQYKPQYTLRLVEEKVTNEQELLSRATKRATGEVIGFLNPQEEYLPGALAAVQQAFQAHPEVDLFIAAAQEKGNEQTIVTPLFLEYLWTTGSKPIPSTLFVRSSLLREEFALNPEEGSMIFSEWLLRLFQAGKKVDTLAFSTSLIPANTKQEQVNKTWRQAPPASMRLLGPWWKFKYSKASRAVLARVG